MSICKTALVACVGFLATAHAQVSVRIVSLPHPFAGWHASSLRPLRCVYVAHAPLPKLTCTFVVDAGMRR
jgi:hypothetical protein